ncbi:LuxR C-terminal-related transcriptional regulator [Saccharopolyspora sp. ASAGF58]|uniref:helix-turn-helix transcriptional regulator n=1 Tax=Saccharopolyspora sp. ASAGF58 TaxID=2719023 RepID=UPI001FF0AD39|nr:LuxR C-terminal-related transcriptional regulator [Saccharopolyspora sp. ASAGF58]
MQYIDLICCFTERTESITVVPVPIWSAARPPIELTSFVGRWRELADVKKFLSSSRLVTITGVGGVGKTRLALRSAALLRRSFPGGVWIIELADLNDPRLVADTVAATLGLQQQSGVTPLEHLPEHLRDRPLLLLLDNCEHVLDGCAQLAHSLLKQCPLMRILTTSRQPLGIAGETVMELAPFSVPPERVGTPELENLLQYSAVALLQERAQAANPAFTVTADNAHVVMRLCRQLDGIPLAIELAAVALRFMSAETITVRLDRRFRLLTGGTRTAPTRQQTLQDMVDWSYRLCSAAEQVLWARLSVCGSGFALEAAEAIGSGDGIRTDEVLNQIRGLIDKSIVTTERHPDKTRYRLLETLREYGRDRLVERGETTTVRRKHLHYYRNLVAQAEAEWFSAGRTTVFARLRAEHANLREALEFSASEPGEAQAGLLIASSLRFFWLSSGFVYEGRRWLERLLTLTAERDTVRVKALYVNGYLNLALNDATSGTALLDQARALAAELGDQSGAAYVAQISGLTALYNEDPARAAALFEDALAGHRLIGDHAAVAYDQIELALALAFLGDHERAAALFRECPALEENYGEQWMRSLALWAQGIAGLLAGDYQQATAAELESLRLKLDFHEHFRTALCIEILACIASADGDAARAATLFGVSHKIKQNIDASLAGHKHIARLHDHYEAVARSSLGEDTFQEAFELATLLDFDEAIAWITRDPSKAGSPTSSATEESPTPMLTPREREVAALVAQGKTNKEIAATMSISRRTADSHVDHILTKLGFTRRTQIAAWITKQEPH